MDALLVSGPPSLNAALALLGATALIFFVPGYLLSRLLLAGEQVPWIARVAVSAGLSLAVAIALATLVLALDWPLEALLWLICGVALLAALWLLRQRRRSASTDTRPAALPPAHPLLLAAFVLVTVLALVRFALPINRMPSGADFWTYLAYVRKWAAFGPRPAVHVTFGQAAPFGFRYILGGWLLVQALLSACSSIDPIDLAAWWLPPLLMTVSYLGLYTLALTLFRSKNAAMLACLAQVAGLAIVTASDDSLQRVFFARIGEDKFLLTFVLLPIAAAYMARFLRSGSKRDFAGLALLCLALPLTHPLGLPEAGLAFGPFAALHWLASRDKQDLRRLLAALALFLVLATIPLIERGLQRKVYTTQGSENEESIQAGLVEGRLLILDAERDRYLVDPAMLVHPLILAGLALSPLTLLYARKEAGAQYLLALTATLLLALFTPLVAPLVGRLITPWVLWRLVFLFPSSLTIAFALHKGLMWAEKALARKTARPVVWAGILPLAVLALAMAALSLAGLVGWPQTIQGLPQRAEMELLAQARPFAEQPSVFMCARPLDTLLPATLANGFVPVSHKVSGHAAAKADVAAFYAADRVDATTWDILQRLNCDYAIVAREDLPQYAWAAPHLEPVAVTSQHALLRVNGASQGEAAPPLLMGHALYAEGRLAEAALAYEQALPDSPLIAGIRLGEVWSQTGALPEAVALLEQTLARYPDSPWAHLTLANAQRLQGDPQAAIAHYQQALALAGTDETFPAATLEAALATLASRGVSALSLAPQSERERWGVVVNPSIGEITDFDLERLGIGWYADGRTRPAKLPEMGAAYVQTIALDADEPPAWNRIARAVEAHPGSIWLVGLRPESLSGGNLSPDAYAAAYHDVYAFLRERDLSAIIVAGGIHAPTPLRLAWLDEVIAAYQLRYGAKLPADAWHTGLYILPEDDSPAGIGLPAGLEATTGQSYSVTDNASLAILQQQVRDMRQWMARNEERHKPLLISGYGVKLPPKDVGEGSASAGRQRIVQFMTDSFDYLRSARDSEIGYPPDTDRLVQRWLWDSLNDSYYNEDTGAGSNSMLYKKEGDGRVLTPYGEAFVAYMATLQP